MNLIISALLFATAPAAHAAVARPPQFVAMAFDNCTENERWKELADFLDEMNKTGDKLHFTYFVSGVNYVADAKRSVYKGPRTSAGKANIDWGGTTADVKRRIDFINAAFKSGNEIASHAVGHFDGGQWSQAEWAQELKSYDDILGGIARINGSTDLRTGFTPKDLVGFRAPYLSNSPGLYAVLASKGYRYDTSSDDEANAWPAKKGGVWRFNLANLKIADSGKKTLSMDYNFFASQSKAEEDPRNYSSYRSQMLKTYLSYFTANYSGNRAPIHIGHHFFNYQGGVYNQALKAFARSVCGLPEVRCVTYSKLADFMDGLSADTIKSYQRGDFPKAAAPRIDAVAALTQLPPLLAIEPASGKLAATFVDADASRFPASVLTWELDGREIGQGPSLDISRLPDGRDIILTVALKSAEGKRIAAQSRPIRRNRDTVALLAPAEMH